MGRNIMRAIGAVSVLALAACTPAAEGAQHAGTTVRSSMQDNVSAWRDLFTYSPRDKRALLPQSRYCYQMQSDIVCYDSPQPNMTAKLTGYQDGTNVSWVQPGGGSLGVSGGEPTAPHGATHVQVAPNLNAVSAPVMSVSSSALPPDDYSYSAPIMATDVPFYKGESPYAAKP